jgi:hypothetical protein
MPGIDEDNNVWRYLVREPSDFDKFRVNDLTPGVKVTLGRMRGTTRWEIQNYIAEKKSFQNKESVRSWIDGHLKGAIHALVDFRFFTEYKRQALNAYVIISRVE